MKAAPPVVLNPEGRVPGLIVVDHAGRSVPEALGDLGLDAAWHDTHHFCDLGVAELAHLVAARLDVPVVLCDVSRLVLDVNRWLHDARSILTQVEGVAIRANIGLDEAARRARREAVFWPYHEAVGRVWASRVRRCDRPFFFALHSCTRVFDGLHRPWDGGTIWHEDPRMARDLLAGLGRESGLTLGDNQPYSGLSGIYTVDRHSYGSGLPACGFEVSNDLLQTPGDRAAWADRLVRALGNVVAAERAA